MNFTDPLLRSLKAQPSKQLDYFDEKVSGLCVRVSPKGTKTFFVRYRYQGTNRRLKLGRYGEMGISDARARARAVRQQVSLGLDPSLERKRALRPPEHDFAGLVEAFIEQYAKLRTKGWKEAARILRRDFVAVWKHRDITDIKKRDVSDLLSAIAASHPSAANHAFAHIRKLFNWAVEHDYLSHSPCVGLKRPAIAEPRERVLSDSELVAIWHAASIAGYPYGPLVHLLILTAQRRTEVAAMEWHEINVDDATWTIPTRRTKGKRSNFVPLSQAALSVIANIPQLHPTLVFPARGADNPVSGFSKWKRALDESSGIKNWALHDLRRTAATGLASLGTAHHVVELILNHRVGSLSQVARIYNLHEYRNERRQALDAWAQKVEQLLFDSAEPRAKAPQ